MGATNLVAALAATGLTFADFAKILVHQVSLSSLQAFLEVAQVPADKVLVTVPYLGNMISASVPVGFDLAESRGEIRRGDKVLFIGLAAGISLGILMFEY
jgi:3-oxoacyl-[acyl-carrier-protein] synthase-3